MKMVDWRAVGLGALVAMAITLPAALIGQAVVEDSEPTDLVFLLLLPVLVGFGAGGFAAARRAPAGPLANGALAALAAFAIVQGIGLVRRLLADEPVEPQSIAFAALLAYSAGLLGALLASRAERRTV